MNWIQGLNGAVQSIGGALRLARIKALEEDRDKKREKYAKATKAEKTKLALTLAGSKDGYDFSRVSDMVAALQSSVDRDSIGSEYHDAQAKLDRVQSEGEWYRIGGGVADIAQAADYGELTVSPVMLTTGERAYRDPSGQILLPMVAGGALGFGIGHAMGREKEKSLASTSR